MLELRTVSSWAGQPCISNRKRRALALRARGTCASVDGPIARHGSTGPGHVCLLAAERRALRGPQAAPDAGGCRDHARAGVAGWTTLVLFQRSSRQPARDRRGRHLAGSDNASAANRSPRPLVRVRAMARSSLARNVAAALAGSLCNCLPHPGSRRAAAKSRAGAYTRQPIDASSLSAKPKLRGKREVLFVGNNWEGTADVIVPRGKFRRLARINIIPDIEERMAEIATDPERLGYFLAIRELVGEGNDQYVDDMYSSNDGRLLIVSRPSFRDVIALDLASGEIVWRFVVDGQRSDHMAISPDGTQRRRLGLDRQRRPHPRHQDRPRGRALRVRRLAAREHLLRGRLADLPRQHRPRLHARRHAGRPTRARASASFRSSTPTPTRSSSASTWARSWPRPAIRT